MVSDFLKTLLVFKFTWCFFVGILGASEIPEEGAAYDYRQWYCKVRGNGFSLKVSQKITIYNERGQDYAELVFSEDSFSKLKYVTIRVLDESGEVLYEREKKDLSKQCGFDRLAIYDDACTYYGTFQAQQFPYSITYDYLKEWKTLFYLGGADFQARLPVYSAVYTLDADNLQDIRYQTNGPADSVTPRLSDDGRALTWTLDSLPALEDVDYLPPGSREPASLALTPGRFGLDKFNLDGTSWLSIGKTLIQMYTDRYLDGATGYVAQGSEPERAVSQMAYKSVIDDVRYVAIEVGVGGWRPYAASLTQERGFGDCKDMSTLLISHLRLAGVESHPVFVLTRGNRPIDPDFPGFRFDHVISLAIVDGDTVWLDPTCNTCPYGELPSMDEDIDVLVGFPSGGRIIRTPASDASLNVRDRETKMHIDSAGRVSFETELNVMGNYAIYLRNALPDKDADETRRFVDGRFPGANKKFKIEFYEIENLDDLEEPVIVRIRAVMTKPERKIGDVLYCSPFMLNKLAPYELAPLDDREYPLNLYYPESYIDRITLSWDPSLDIDSVVVPAGDGLAYSFGEVRLRSWLAGDQVQVELQKKYLAYQADLEQFDDFLAFRKKLKELCGGHVKLISGSN